MFFVIRCNKQSYLTRVHVRDKDVVQDNRSKLAAYLVEHQCIDGGITDIRVLEFDYVQGIKCGDVGRVLTNATSWLRIEAEIAKCEVRCANCHRIKTMERGQWWHFELAE